MFFVSAGGVRLCWWPSISLLPAELVERMTFTSDWTSVGRRFEAARVGADDDPPAVTLTDGRAGSVVHQGAVIATVGAVASEDGASA